MKFYRGTRSGVVKLKIVSAPFSFTLYIKADFLSEFFGFGFLQMLKSIQVVYKQKNDEPSDTGVLK